MSISLFGSHARGDFDDSSDLDVLVVVKDGSGTTSSADVIAAIGQNLNKQPSLSFYGERKLASMFRSGHLFAWHLYLESNALFGGAEVSSIFGEPAPYTSAREDVRGLIQILESVENNIKLVPENAVFEMGILYVCARNIAMSASWHLANSVKFGRYSPYEISEFELPLDKDTYSLSMLCRMASTRGESLPRVSAGIVRKAVPVLKTWADDLAARLGRLA